MRIIKFRGKDDDGNWLYGDLRQRMGYWPTIIESYCTDKGKIGYREIAVKEDTIGQFTGLLDKNGKEIYEGDIFVSDYMSLVHYVGYENGQWIGMDSDGNWIPLLEDHVSISDRLHYIKVIGNIHDNPELLTIPKDR